MYLEVRMLTYDKQVLRVALPAATSELNHEPKTILYMDHKEK